MTREIYTWFEGDWHTGNPAVMKAADHGTWLGTLVFDGARMVDGVLPDLDLHCARANESALALGFNPVMGVDQMMDLIGDGLKRFETDAPVYVRPMMWTTERDEGVISGAPDSTALCICLEEVPMPPPEASATLATTRFRRPTLDCATVNAKAACLYPNNARMVREARAKGFTNALVADAHGNVAETATANVFMVRDGEVLTPVPNGTFLAGITRGRHMALLRAAGKTVTEKTLTFEDFHSADEVFLTGNISKITPVTAFEGTSYQIGPVARLARELYWEWAKSAA